MIYFSSNLSGKTTILNRIVNKHYSYMVRSTVGVEMFSYSNNPLELFGFSISGNSIPSGCGELVDLSYEGTATQITDIIFATNLDATVGRERGNRMHSFFSICKIPRNGDPGMVGMVPKSRS